MTWQRLSIVVPDTQADEVCDLLGELGAISVSVIEDGQQQPLYEPAPGETPLWRRSRISGLFEDRIDLSTVVAAAETGQLLPPDPQWSIDTLQDQVWERAWMDDFHAERRGQRLWVCPSWETPPDPDAINVLMDPGLAFGSGTHPTTTLCLEWLDAHIRGGERVIDYGCGSGILAIAAIKLGAASAWCVDTDPQALTATTDNAARNGVGAQIHSLAPAAQLPDKVPLLVANILAGPLIELAARLTDSIEPGGAVVLSGILDSQADAVAAAYRDGFDLDPISTRHEWVRISGTRRT